MTRSASRSAVPLQSETDTSTQGRCLGEAQFANPRCVPGRIYDEFLGFRCRYHSSACSQLTKKSRKAVSRDVAAASISRLHFFWRLLLPKAETGPIILCKRRIGVRDAGAVAPCAFLPPHRSPLIVRTVVNFTHRVTSSARL